ncbi:MAG: hypothetical protein WD187_03750 [Candidatus Woykebacteria bacterium]
MGPSVGKIALPSLAFLNIGGIVGNLLTIAFFAAALFFLIQVAIGGISWINAGGDPKTLEAARGRITNAVIGIVIVAAAFAITIIVTTALGINIFKAGGITIP